MENKNSEIMNTENKYQRKKSREEYFLEINYKFDPLEDGLLFINYDCIRQQREIPPSMVAQMFSNVVKGKHLLDFQFPIKNYADYSTTLMVILEFKILSFFIDRMIKINDPLERFKIFVSYIIANKHIIKGNEVPVANTLGETCQIQVNDLMIYTECISILPLTILVFGEAKNYFVHGYFKPSTDSGIFTAIHDHGTKVKIILKDKNNSTYSMNYPKFKISGTVAGKRMVSYIGSQIAEDSNNKYFAKVFYHANRNNGFFDNLFSTKVERFDFLRGIITQKEELLKIENNDIFLNKGIVSYLEGYWTEYLKIDEKEFWNFKDFEISEFIKPIDLLPSDESFRKDLQNLVLKNLEEAQKEFDVIKRENEFDENLRRSYKKNK